MRGRSVRWILARPPGWGRPRFTPLLLLLCPLLLLLCASAWAQTGPTVTTDQSDYAPGSTAQITGSGFHASETVTLQVVHADGTAAGGAGHEPWTVTTDANGSFTASWLVNPDDSFGSSFKLTADCLHPVDATDTTPHLHAETMFTDGCNPLTDVSAAVSPSSTVCAGTTVTFAASLTPSNANG